MRFLERNVYLKWNDQTLYCDFSAEIGNTLLSSWINYQPSFRIRFCMNQHISKFQIVPKQIVQCSSFVDFGFAHFKALMRSSKIHTMTPRVRRCSHSLRELSVCQREHYYHITIFPGSFFSPQTITCCLASLALQIRPKARTAMAAAEEIGQN